MGYGYSARDTMGLGTPASADGVPQYKVGGVTIDWDTVPANGSLATLDDGSTIPADEKYLPYGTVLGRITASGKYGPWEDAAVDGRDTSARGEVYILNHTVRYTDPHKDNPPGVFEGGRVYRDRLKIVAAAAFTNTGAWDAVETAMPLIVPVDTDL
jgi:hypothetical protein